MKNLNSEPIEQVRDARTALEMRYEIARLRQHMPVVRAAMDAADYTEASAEDRFTLLAYYALTALARTQQAMHDYVLQMPPRVVFDHATNTIAYADCPCFPGTCRQQVDKTTGLTPSGQRCKACIPAR